MILFSSVLYEKGKYENLDFFIEMEEEYSTPWGYHVVIPAIDLSNDQKLEFTNDIQGEISSAKLSSDENGRLRLFVDYQLHSGEYLVNAIYHTMEQNRFQTFSLMADNPIRDYNGIFNQWSEVEPTYSLKDQSGKLIWKDNVYSPSTRDVAVFITSEPCAGRIYFRSISSNRSTKINFINGKSNVRYMNNHLLGSLLRQKAKSLLETV